MKLATIIFTFSLSLTALADGYDCRKPGSPHGGKFCHYVVPECASEVSCDEAALCAVKQFSDHVSWKDVKNIKVLSSKSVPEEGTTYLEHSVSMKVEGNKVSGTVVTQPNKVRYDGKTVCEPVAVNY